MIKAKKSLGQNFLIDNNILEKITNTTDIENKKKGEQIVGSSATMWILGFNMFIMPSITGDITAMVTDKDGNFSIDDIQGVKLNPIDYSFSLSSITKINYFMTAIKK